MQNTRHNNVVNTEIWVYRRGWGAYWKR